jgi:hypothetical protein
VFLIVHNDDSHAYPYGVDMIAREFSTTREIAFFMAVQIHQRGKISIEFPNNAHAEEMRDRILAYGADVEKEGSTGPLRVEVLESVSKGTYHIGRYINSKLEVAPEVLAYKKSRRIFIRIRRRVLPLSMQLHLVTLLILMLCTGAVLGINVVETVETKNWITLGYRGWPMYGVVTVVDPPRSEVHEARAMMSYKDITDNLAKTFAMRITVDVCCALLLICVPALVCECYLRKLDENSTVKGSTDQNH